MSVPVKDDADDGERDITSMYSPPWARDAATDAADAALGAATNLRRLLPAAAQLKDPEARAWPPTLDPTAVPGPPSQGSRRSVFPFVAWVSAGVGAATFVALLAGVGAPEWLRSVDESTKAFGARMLGKSASVVASKPAEHGAVRVASQPAPMPVTSQPAPLPEQIAAPMRIAAPSVVAPQPPVVVERAAPPAPSAPSAMAPSAVSLEREEIAALYRRGEQLVTQGEIAAARLVFTRAAEAGDARSALALGASYDPEVLRKLGVLGVVGDAVLAREWYTKASGLGSSEAAQRIELMARGP
jgi:TPR repeat protein